jgi:hypothetical protein
MSTEDTKMQAEQNEKAWKGPNPITSPIKWLWWVMLNRERKSGDK